MRYSSTGFLHKSEMYGKETKELGQKNQTIYGSDLYILSFIGKFHF